MAKYLVIVESPAKVKTIKKFLGANYEVEASNGHVRDLPKSQLGIDVENDYEPHYITIRGKGDILANLRKLVKKATTVICMATMLHTIATGNMTPSYYVNEDDSVRPVYLYTVDIDEFVVNKLLDRGSLSATTVVTNVQDFITHVAKGLKLM